MQEEIIQGNKEINIHWFNEDRLFELACIIDNDYRQYRCDRKCFVITRTFQRIGLKTNKCDWACLISITYDGKQKVTHIKRLAEDTHGWQDVTQATMDRILSWYNNQIKDNGRK